MPANGSCCGDILAATENSRRLANTAAINMPSARVRMFIGTLVVWVAVGVFWFVVTRSFHPTLRLAIIVTTSLVSAYAMAVYLNHLVLIPRQLRRGRIAGYVATLVGTMILLTAVALTINRTSYIKTLGPDPDPNGLYHHFEIDFAGMTGHVLTAAGIVWMWNRIAQRSGQGD
jgi:hypothetical protein